MGPREAGSGRVGPVWGVSGVGHALGVRLGPGDLATRIGQVGPRGAGLGRGGVGRAEWGWACIGIPLNYSKTRLWLQGRGWALIGTWLQG